jgi:hypothetical protein
MKIRLFTLYILMLVVSSAVAVGFAKSVMAVEVEPTYNNPVSFEEKEKEEVDEEPSCD